MTRFIPDHRQTADVFTFTADEQALYETLLTYRVTTTPELCALSGLTRKLGEAKAKRVWVKMRKRMWALIPASEAGLVELPLELPLLPVYTSCEVTVDTPEGEKTHKVYGWMLTHDPEIVHRYIASDRKHIKTRMDSYEGKVRLAAADNPAEFQREVEVAALDRDFLSQSPDLKRATAELMKVIREEALTTH